MWDKLKRGASELTGGLAGKKPDGKRAKSKAPPDIVPKTASAGAACCSGAQYAAMQTDCPHGKDGCMPEGEACIQWRLRGCGSLRDQRRRRRAQKRAAEMKSAARFCACALAGALEHPRRSCEDRQPSRVRRLLLQRSGAPRRCFKEMGALAARAPRPLSGAADSCGLPADASPASRRPCLTPPRRPPARSRPARSAPCPRRSSASRTAAARANPPVRRRG